MTLRDVRLSDTEGMFADSPELTVDWRPAAWLANRLQINEFTPPLIRLHRLPKLTPSQHKDGAILPGDRKRVVEGQGVSVRVDPGGRRVVKQKKITTKQNKAN